MKSTEVYTTSRLRFRLFVPKTGIRLQFWTRGRRRVFPRLPLVDFAPLPLGSNGDLLTKEALEKALKDACQADWEVLRPPPPPWVDLYYRMLLAQCASKTGDATESPPSDDANKLLEGIDGSDP